MARHSQAVNIGRKALFVLLLTTTALPAGIALTTSSSFAQAQTTFQVPPGTLAGALATFGRQSGTQLSYDASIAVGKTSPGISGAATREQALAAILQGSGLSYSFRDATNVLISGPGLTGDVAPPADGSTLLDTIVVKGGGASGAGYMGTPDWVYETPDSVSVVSREALQRSGARNVRDAVASAPGVYSGEGQGSFPTVSPNIRGVGDSGRVVVSIDGARQNAQDGGRYGGGMGGYGTAFVDSAFIREVDIERNPGATAGNAGSLGGSVDFRTIGADDIIVPGKGWGVEATGTLGSNQHRQKGSVIAATRLGDTLALTAGLSGSDFGEYDAGKHGEVTGSNIYNMNGKKTWSSLLKLEGDFGDVSASLSWMHQQNDFAYSPTGTSVGSRFSGRNDSVSASLGWNPDNPLINAKANFWLNSSRIDELRDARLTWNGGIMDPETLQERDMLSFGGTIENTSEFDTTAGPLTLNYGVEAFRDDATSRSSSDHITANPLIATGWLPYNRPGERDVVSAFANARWEPTDWVNFFAGLHHDWYRLHGTARYFQQRVTQTTTPDRTAGAVTTWGAWAQVNSPAIYNVRKSICDTGLNPNNGVPVSATARQSNCNSLLQAGEPIDGVWRNAGVVVRGVTTYVTDYPEYANEVDRTDSAWLPSATVEFKPTDWLRPYVSYSQSFRPPTTNEAFFYGSVIPANFPGTSGAPNLNLRGEHAETWEAGLNISHDGLLKDGDALRIKASAFRRTIDDYIVLGFIRTPEVETQQYESFVNAAGDTKMHGVEIEGNYDAGAFWLGGAFTWLETRWPQKTETFSNAGGTTDGQIFAFAGAVPPRFKVSVDAGVRLFDERLAVGGRVTHVTPNLARYLDQQGNLSETSSPYTTVDLYSSLKVTDWATLNVSVQNLTDRRYVPATGSYLAPGRTFLASFTTKF